MYSVGLPALTGTGGEKKKGDVSRGKGRTAKPVDGWDEWMKMDSQKKGSEEEEKG